MAKYKAGDVVKLKSGGPNMTVHGYSAVISNHESKNVMCKWFAGAKSESCTFHEDMLIPVEGDKDKK